MFIEITQPNSFSWGSILATFTTSIVSAGLGAWLAYYFMNKKEKNNAYNKNNIAITIIKEKSLITFEIIKALKISIEALNDFKKSR